MASQYLSFAGSPATWDRIGRPRAWSSTSTDMSIPEEGHPQGGGGSGSGATTATGEPRRRIGRPIAYTGDPDAQHLTEIERRHIKRRIANRESARRVRRKRQNALEDMKERLEQVQEHTLMLSARLQQAERERVQLVQELCEMRRRAGEASNATAAAALARQDAELLPPPAAVAGAIIKLEPGGSIAGTGPPPRSNASNNAGTITSGAMRNGDRRPDDSAPLAGLPPEGGSVPWCRAGFVDLPMPRQPMFVAVTPATSCTRVRCSTGKPALTPTSPQVQPPPLPSGIPLLDLQSMSSADDPLDCFLGSKPSRLKEEAANPLGLVWRF